MLPILFLPIMPANASFKVTYSGCVEQPNTVEVSDKLSLFDALTHAGLSRCAYEYGAAWMEPFRIPEQQRLKNALLTDIHALIQAMDTRYAIHYFRALESLITKQRVTGRVLDTDLTLFHVEMQPLKNRMLTRDASFYFPQRPQSIQLVGFELESMAYDANVSVNDIVNQTPICSHCRPGWVWIVYPNASVAKVKVGLWTNIEFYAPPGSWIISEFTGLDVEKIAPKFYLKLTKWLATQVIH